jgi:hypothetical protein
MGRDGAGIGIAAIGAAVVGALFPPAIGALSGLALHAAGGALFAGLGATFGAIGLLLKPKPRQPNEATDLTPTGVTRNSPVPIVFGRARVSGNIIDLGAFVHAKINGQHVTQINDVVALCEGPIRAAGNVHQDTKPINPIDQWYTLSKGTNNQDIPARVLNKALGYLEPKPVPWRDTALWSVRSTVDTPHFADVNTDLFGPDYTVRRSSDDLGESSPNDVPAYVFYDGYTESYYATLSASGATSSPFGLVKVPRNAAGRAHTAPPQKDITGADWTADARHAWYVGRHDDLIFQDASRCDTFWFGRWGLARNSNDWQAHKPHSGYANQIICHYLDELNGYLHTLHDDGTTIYIMRWALMSGRVDRIDTDIARGTFKAILYSVDLGCYAIASASTLYLVNQDTGLTFQSTNAIDTTDCLGLCHSGQRIGVLSDTALFYYDPYRDLVSEPFGSSSTGIGKGHLGGAVSYFQNSWTGQVVTGKDNGSGSAVYVSFIPSVVETKGDISALGTAAGFYGTTQIKEFQDYTSGGTFDVGTSETGFARDWSWRDFNSFDQISLQGFSSAAAAMWAACVDERNIDSERFGAGFPSEYFSLPSFESVHAYCVGGVVMNGTQVVTVKMTDAPPITGSNVKTVMELEGDLRVSDKQIFAVSDGSFTARQISSTGGCWHQMKLFVNGQLVHTWPKIPISSSGDFKTYTFQVEAGNRIRLYMDTNCTPAPPPVLTPYGTYKTVTGVVIGAGYHDVNARGSVTVTNGAARLYSERYKIDLELNQQRSASDVLTNELLTSINGYRTVVDGQLHVAIRKPGLLPQWSFSENELSDGSPNLQFVGRGDGVNSVRVQYRDVADDYRLDFAPADDEFDQLARGRVQQKIVSVTGIGRFGHADILAKQILDQAISTRRQLEFKLHYVGLALVPGDGIAITHAATGLNGAAMDVVSLSEDEDGTVKIMAQDHRRQVDYLLGAQSQSGSQTDDDTPTCDGLNHVYKISPISDLDSTISTDTAFVGTEFDGRMAMSQVVKLSATHWLTYWWTLNGANKSPSGKRIEAFVDYDSNTTLYTFRVLAYSTLTGGTPPDNDANEVLWQGTKTGGISPVGTYTRTTGTIALPTRDIVLTDDTVECHGIEGTDDAIVTSAGLPYWGQQKAYGGENAQDTYYIQYWAEIVAGYDRGCTNKTYNQEWNGTIFRLGTAGAANGAAWSSIDLARTVSTGVASAGGLCIVAVARKMDCCNWEAFIYCLAGDGQARMIWRGKKTGGLEPEGNYDRVFGSSPIPTMSIVPSPFGAQLINWTATPGTVAVASPSSLSSDSGCPSTCGTTWDGSLAKIGTKYVSHSSGCRKIGTNDIYVELTSIGTLTFQLTVYCDSDRTRIIWQGQFTAPLTSPLPSGTYTRTAGLSTSPNTFKVV